MAKKSYHKSTKGKIDKDLRSGLLTAILKFAEKAFTEDSVEYFKGEKFLIAFKYDEIKDTHDSKTDLLISYAIIDKEKRAERYIHKIIQPLLTKVIVEFKSRNLKKNLSEYSQFKEFKQVLDKIFRTDSQTANQKLKGIFHKTKRKKEVKTDK